MRKPTVKKLIFYTFIFLSGFVYQPTWVYENFWYRADFYDSLPFDFPYFAFLFIYSILLTFFVANMVRFAKKLL